MSVDLLTLIIRHIGEVAVADHLGDVRESAERLWEEAGLGPFPVADGGEPIEDSEATYDAGDIMPERILAVTGIDNLERRISYRVSIEWARDDGECPEVVLDVKADSPMDAARVAYHLACEAWCEHEIGYATAVVAGERFECAPVCSVMVTREDEP
jgi:hypothetical protein